MAEAVQLAMRGRGYVEPNPRVGALAIAGDRIVGRGWHEAWGGPHAEVQALRDAARARGESGGALPEPDTLVVTLEPCSAAKGEGGKKTPPCVDAIVKAGIRRVIVGTTDPDPRHRGSGLTDLEEHGIDVVDGVFQSRCREINNPFKRWLGLDRPWTIAKWAMTLDGKTAAPSGESRWISCRESRIRVHALRAACDGVVVGYRTAVIDDPELTVRHVEGPHPVRIVVDPMAAIADDSRLVKTAREIPTWALVNVQADAARTGRLADAGVQVIQVPPAEGGRRLHLLHAWRELRERGLRRLLVEGGGGLTAQLWGWDCIDQVLAFVSPKVIGGAGAATPVGGEGKPFMAEAWQLEDFSWEPSGQDLAVSAFTA